MAVVILQQVDFKSAEMEAKRHRIVNVKLLLRDEATKDKNNRGN